MQSILSRRPWAACALVLATLTTPVFAGSASIEAITGMPGGDMSFSPQAVSADGLVITGYVINQPSEGSPLSFDAVRWTAETGTVDLGNLPGFESSLAYDISADGAVITGSARTASSIEAFRWTAADGMMSLGNPPGGDFGSEAYATSYDGSVIVGDSEVEFGGVHAMRWSQGGGMEVLEFDAPISVSTSVSPDGSVITGTYLPQGSPHGAFEAFRWSAETGIAGIGTLPGETSSQAVAVSANGTVIVGNSPFGIGGNAVRWTAATGMEALTSDPNHSPSDARDVTPDGTVIVGSASSSNSTRAMIWTESDGLRFLHDVLTDDYGLDLTGWTLRNAIGISADGSVIVGTGDAPGIDGSIWIVRLPASACGCPGDVNADGSVNGGDIPAFIDCLLDGTGDCLCANTDGLAGVTFADVQYFATSLINGMHCP